MDGRQWLFKTIIITNLKNITLCVYMNIKKSQYTDGYNATASKSFRPVMYENFILKSMLIKYCCLSHEISLKSSINFKSTIYIYL